MKLLLSFLTIFSIFVPSVFSQINEQDSSVRTIAYWDLGETYSYKVSLENFDVVGTDTLRRTMTSYVVDMLILDSTETSYDVQWTYRDMDFEMDQKDSIVSAITKKLMNLTGGSVVEFRTDEFGAFQEVTNWEQIRDYYLVAQDSMEAFFGNVPAINDFVSNIMKVYLSKSSIESNSIRDVRQFLNFHGGEYKLNEPIQNTVELPTVSGQGQLNASLTVELERIYPEDDEYLIYSIIECDPSQLKEQTRLVMKTMFPNVSDEEIQEELDAAGELWNVIENSSLIHYWGWPTYSKEFRQTGSNKQIKAEIRTIELV
jgi:hypothetical protein